MSDDFTPVELEEARKLFAGPCDFMLGVAGLGQLPEADMPEIAFAGRSNVGKSSLVNALTGRKTLAKTSNTPGRTQQLNYFNLGGRLYMVDMPGYGYAKVSKDKRDNWTRLVFDYLRGRPNLRCVFILVDARHGLKESDIELMKMLDETAVQYRIILTKADKVKNQDLQKISEKIVTTLKKHAAGFPGILATSAEKGGGIPECRAVLASYGL
ncbi:MAG: ribosome biogenesis GTP-binding protein YihA/YsxC [Alphaproteobacteria bacterium]